MKTSIYRLLSLVMAIFLLAIPASATTNSPGENEIMIEEHLSLADENISVRELSAEEAAVALSDEYEISYSEALNNVIQDIAKGTGYHEATITKNFGKAPDGTVYADWVIEVGALFKTATGGGHSNFTGEAISVWSKPISSGGYTWDQSYEPIAEITGTTNNSIYLQVRGTVIVEYTDEEGMGFEMNILPEVLNFTFSSAITGTNYFRKIGSISGTYTMSGY